MSRRLPQWRQRLLDVAVVLGVLTFAAQGWPKFPLGASAYAAAFFIWSAGLSVMGHYKTEGAATLSGLAGKLLIDHAILCAVWMGALFLFGTKPGVGFVVSAGAASFAGLILVRVRGAFWQKWTERISVLPMAVDVVLGLVVFFAVNGLWWSLAFPLSLLGAVILGRALTQLLGALIRRPLVGWLTAQGLFIILLLGLRPVLQWTQTPAQLVWGAGLLPAVFLGLRQFAVLRRPRSDPQETARKVTLAAGIFALLFPLFSAQLMGAGDAKLYAEAMQDFLAQIKAGIFPVFVSQSEIAPWGSVFPFRMAFYHFHFGALLDLLTFHSLNVYAVQHLTLILSGAGGTFGLYACLKRLAPERPWECVALALLYLSCPTWLSAFYGLDMYFTVMTLPWLPLVIHGVIRTFQPECGWRDYLLLGVALAATWLAHPPVGFWATGVVALSQLLRLGTAGRWPARRDLGGLTLALVACLVLCAGLFVSLADVRIPGEIVDPSQQVLSSIRDVIPRVFKPVSPAAERLSDMQLGYAWQLLLLAGVLLGPRPAGRARWILIGLTTFLLLLIYPVPGITPLLWHSMPWEVTNITNVWPMQRLYPIVATLAAFIAIGTLKNGRLTRTTGWRLGALSVLCLWSGLEAAKFLRRGHVYTKPVEATRVISKIENSPLLSSWTAYTPQLPSHVLVGRVDDPHLRNRLLDAGTLAERISNFDIAAKSDHPPAHPVVANAVRLDAGVLQLTPNFVLQPGQRYQLTFEFLDYDSGGVLQLLPMHDIHYRFYREVSFPQGRRPAPFTLTVWTSEPTPLTIDLLFRPIDPAYADTARPNFLSYELTPFRGEELPIKITSLAPYQATVETSQPSFLETHRFFARGYRATVNGRIVPVTESPQHLAMLPLEAGKNDVRLDYIGPPSVRAAFWMSAIAWIAMAGYGAWRVVQSWLARSPASRQSTSSSFPAS